MSRTLKIPTRLQDEYLQSGNLKWNPSFEAEILNPIDGVQVVKMTAVYDHDLQRYACSSITLERKGAGTEITGALLREIRVAEDLQYVALHNIWVDSVVRIKTPISTKINGKRHTNAVDVLDNIPKVSGRTTDSNALHAALVYAIAEVSGMPVLKTIGKALGTSQSTAQRLIARAHALEYLPESSVLLHVNADG